MVLALTLCSKCSLKDRKVNKMQNDKLEHRYLEKKLQSLMNYCRHFIPKYC